jgi:type II secretory pathway pseudopilin PulG
VKKDERGISLVELIVAMSLLLVVSAVVIGTYQAVVGSLGTSNLLNKNTQQASNGMNEAAREIRAATSNPVSGHAVNDPAVVSATNESVVIYAYVNLQSSSDQQPVQVRLRVDPSTRVFYEDIWSATQNSSGYWIFPATTTAPRSTRALSSVVASRVSPNPYTFTYMAGTTALAVPTGGFTTAQLLSITSIQITLTIQNTLIDASRPVTLQNTVGMPNLNQ